MGLLKLILTVAALIAGLVSAYYWHKASKVRIRGDGFEPVDTDGKQIYWNAAIMEAAEKSASLNRTAAIWTALAVFLGGLLSAASYL
jgi:hypothetical protein